MLVGNIVMLGSINRVMRSLPCRRPARLFLFIGLKTHICLHCGPHPCNTILCLSRNLCTIHARQVFFFFFEFIVYYAKQVRRNTALLNSRDSVRKYMVRTNSKSAQSVLYRALPGMGTLPKPNSGPMKQTKREVGLIPTYKGKAVNCRATWGGGGWEAQDNRPRGENARGPGGGQKRVVEGLVRECVIFGEGCHVGGEGEGVQKREASLLIRT